MNQPMQRPENRQVKINGHKHKLVVISSTGEEIPLEYRSFRDGKGSVQRVITGPIRDVTKAKTLDDQAK